MTKRRSAPETRHTRPKSPCVRVSIPSLRHHGALSVPRQNTGLSPNSYPPVHAGLSRAVVWRCGLLKLDLARRHSGGYPHSHPPQTTLKNPAYPPSARLRPGRLPIRCISTCSDLAAARPKSQPRRPHRCWINIRARTPAPIHPAFALPSPNHHPNRLSVALRQPKPLIQRREPFPRPGFIEMA